MVPCLQNNPIWSADKGTIKQNSGRHLPTNFGFAQDAARPSRTVRVETLVVNLRQNPRYTRRGATQKTAQLPYSSGEEKVALGGMWSLIKCDQ